MKINSILSRFRKLLLVFLTISLWMSIGIFLVSVIPEENKPTSSVEVRVLPQKQRASPKPIATISPTPSPSINTKKAVLQPTENEDTWRVEKMDEHTTDSRMPPDNRMATSDELFLAINEYRGAHSIPQVQKHEILCRIAQERADQLLRMNELDTHEGFESFARSQKDFDNMGEIIQGGVQPNLAVHIVEWGWGRSLTGHKESMLKREWTHGCGGVAGYFSVFIFGSN